MSHLTLRWKCCSCDNDANYGRLIDMFVSAVEFSQDMSWARAHLPTVHAMAANVLARRAAAVAAFPPSSPLHGIVPGSPDHDICHNPGYYFASNVWFVRGLLSLGRLHAENPHSLSMNTSVEAALLPTATAWRADIHTAAEFTAVKRSDGNGRLYFLSPVVGSVYSMANEAQLLEGGNQTDCVERGTCFASMSAGLPGGGSNQKTDYANFDMFSETLLAAVLAPEFELAIMDFRESHRGTLMGMTRFRDLLDDLYILGYGQSSLRYDRLAAFHSTLAGHSLNFLSRGTYWSAEQRAQLGTSIGNGEFVGDTTNGTGIKDHRYRNDCGVGAQGGSAGAEDCSLDMISSVASAYWVRSMLVSGSQDDRIVFIGRGAPRRWFQQAQPFGIDRAPTRFGKVSFTMNALVDAMEVSGSVTLSPTAAVAELPTVAVHIRSPAKGKPFTHVSVVGHGATLAAWHAANETARFKLAPGHVLGFNFSASYSS